MTASTGYDIISADAHVLEPLDLFATRLPSSLQERAPKPAPFDGGEAWHLDGLDPVPLPVTAATGSGYNRPRLGGDDAIGFGDALAGLHDPAARLLAQDADSIDGEVLYPSPGLWDAIVQLEDQELKLACTRAYNDWIAEFCAHEPSRLIGLAKIPTTGAKDATVELQRCIEELGLKGAVLDAWPSTNGAAGDEADDVFWEAVDGLGVPVSLHYAIGGKRPTIPTGSIAPGLKPPMADPILPLIGAGVFDRFPNLRLVLAHGDAGWANHWLEFMDGNYLRHRHLEQYALANPDALPSQYVRKHTWFTFHHDRSAVKNRHKVSGERLMWASHFPHDDSNWPDDREQAMRVTDEVPQDERRALLAGNVARLYRLPGHEDGFADAALDSFEQLIYF